MYRWLGEELLFVSAEQLGENINMIEREGGFGNILSNDTSILMSVIRLLTLAEMMTDELMNKLSIGFSFN